LSSSYRPISLLDTIGKLFEKILLAGILHDGRERKLMGDEQFGVIPRHSTSLQLVRLFERITRNVGEKRLTDAVFLAMAKSLDTAWFDGLLYKLSLLYFPSYILHTISSYLLGRTSRNPALLVSYLESYLSDLQRWFSERRFAINVSKSTAIIFGRAGRRFIQPRPVTFFGEPIHCVDANRYLGVTLDSRLTWSLHIDQFRKKTAQRMGMLGTLLNKKSDLSVWNGILLYKQLMY